MTTSEIKHFSFEVWGANALYTDPLSRGGEKATFSVPTYQSLIGISESIYWKPTFNFVIDRVRVMNPIRIESKAMRPLDKNFALDKNTLAYYTYLRDVRYQVELHMVWNLNRPDLAQDRNLKKHAAIFNRSLNRGGRRDIFLGTRECQGYVKPVTFGEGVGAYDDLDELNLGMMVHGFNYPSETGVDELSVRLWVPKMRKGIIDFQQPSDVKTVQTIRPMKDYAINNQTRFTSVDDEYTAMFGGDGE